MVLIPKIYIITNKEISTKEQIQYLKNLQYLKTQDVILQIRMPHLKEDLLCDFIKKTLEVVPSNIKVLINSRIDLMERFELDGVHFKDKDISVDLKKYKNKGKIFAKSTHSIKSIEDAIKNYIDFVTFGPVFYTKSKEKYGKPIGFEILKDKRFKIPIFALGGVDLNSIKELPEGIFYGVGGIKLFSNYNIINNIIKINSSRHSDSPYMNV